MPIGRYFLYVGGVLLALLFIVDWCYPPLTPTAVNTSVTGTDFDRSIIRIHSTRKWPQAVVIDTTLPTIVPPPSMTAMAAPRVPVAKPVREALAMAIEPAKPKESTKPAKPRVRHVRVARAAPRFAPYGMFGYNTAWPAGW